MRIHSLQVLKVTIVLLAISITTMAHDKANAASRFTTPQKKADVPEWFKIFEKKTPQQGLFQQKFQPAPVNSVRSIPSTPAPRPTGLVETPQAIQYRNALLEKPQVSLPSNTAAPTAATPSASASIHMKETSRATIRGGSIASCVGGGMMASGSVYRPFDTNAPSDYTAGGSTPATSEGPRKGFGGGPEWGEGPCPVGEPWILLAFVTLFGAAMIWKGKRNSLINKTEK